MGHSFITSGRCERRRSSAPAIVDGLLRTRLLPATVAISLAFASAGFAANPVSACFLNTKEASGVSVIAFATGQQIAAEICDRTYGLWSPLLLEIAAQVMANSARNPIIAEFMADAQQYAIRRHITIADLFREIGESLRHLRSAVSDGA